MIKANPIPWRCSMACRPGPTDGRTGGRSTPNTGGSRNLRPPSPTGASLSRVVRPHTLRKNGQFKVNRPFYLCPSLHHRTYRWLRNWLCAESIQPPFEKAAHPVYPNTIREATKGLGQVAVEEEQKAPKASWTWSFLKGLSCPRRSRILGQWYGPGRR